MLVKNLKQKGITITTSYGTFIFNNEGVADVTPDEFAMKLIEVPGYEAVEDVPDKAPEQESEASETPQNDEVDDNVENTSYDEEKEQEEQTEEANFDKMNVPQLKKYAKDNNIELNGASKKDEIIAIILGAAN